MKFLANLLKPIKLNFNSTKSIRTNILDNLILKKDGHLALVSLSTNIHYNLALENHLAEAYDLKNCGILLIWLSDPTIVFGRHQNPWLECNVKEATEKSIVLARRYSGGGCVYHDLGNLNISFITHRPKYDRKLNLNIIKQALESEKFNLNNEFEISLSPRHDIFVKSKNDLESSGFKITGSASRLAKQFSYHHCTLLFDSNISQISYLLKSNLINNIKTKATPSVSSKCTNMRNHTSLNLKTIDMIHLICEQYWAQHWPTWSIETLFKYVDPEDANLAPLFEKNLKELESWDFKFAYTPQFELSIELAKENSLILVISNGLVKEFRFSANEDDSIKNHIGKLIGVKFIKNDLVNALLEDINLELFNSNDNFKHILEFINKNIS